MRQICSIAQDTYRVLSIVGIACLSMSAAFADDDEARFIPKLIVSSTIPANGDLNPYGVAFVPQNFPKGGSIAPGDVLISNFNNSCNLQGTGTTIVKLTPNGIIAPPPQPLPQNSTLVCGTGGLAVTAGGNAVTFFTSKLLGLSTALGVLQGGFVIVGNVPTTDGTFGTLSNGALQIIDRNGNLVNTFSDSNFSKSGVLDSPWDLTINDNGNFAQVFVSNVLSGHVSRLDLAVGPSNVTLLHGTVIANGYAHDVPNAAALVLGPTGLAYDKSADVLYVASTADNKIYAVQHAAIASSPVTKGNVIFASPRLRGPLALGVCAEWGPADSQRRRGQRRPDPPKRDH